MPLGEHLKISFKRFYTERVKRGTMPVHTRDGWYFSSDKKHFDAFLNQFCDEDKKFIKSGVKLIKPKENLTQKIAGLISEMREDEVRLILEEIK